MAGTGPANLQRMGKGLKARTGRVRVSRAASQRVSPRAGAVRGVKIPNGAAGGIAKASTPLMKSPGRTINRPKSTGRGKSRINLKPKADGASRI